MQESCGHDEWAGRGSEKRKAGLVRTLVYKQICYYDVKSSSCKQLFEQLSQQSVSDPLICNEYSEKWLIFYAWIRKCSIAQEP